MTIIPSIKNKLIMGILNLTPDSFYDGNQNLTPEFITRKINKIISSDIIDVGAESSRPGAKPISDFEEIKRLSVLDNIDFDNNKILSIDSYKKEVIEYALNNGFKIVNDITGGGKDLKNINLAYKYDASIILMHMQGNPINMQNNPQYDNLIDDINNFFDERIHYAETIGMERKKIILDPGIGFGKSYNDNYQILLNLNEFKHFDCKVLIGTSRKSFLSINNDKPSQRLTQSIISSMISLYSGADILRVHDVEEHMKMFEIIKRCKK